MRAPKFLNQKTERFIGLDVFANHNPMIHDDIHVFDVTIGVNVARLNGNAVNCECEVCRVSDFHYFPHPEV